ncbi:MAG TPA: Ger(x)C family spore germination protein [Bacillota bacterium]|nr:Ger(x)C family spore germination protein [Bacillota bacterium]
MRNKIKRLIIFLLLFPLLAGCMGKREIDDLAIVTAVGFDQGGENGKVRITAQIVRPADARGQTGAPSGGTGEPIYSITAEGESIMSAMRNLGRFSSRRVFWAQNFIIAINEKVAREGITDIIDFFTRNHETRMETWVVVTPDNAGKLVSTVTGLEVIPGSALDKLFRYNEIVAEAPRTNIMRLEESYLSESTQPILARMKLRNREISNKKPEEFGSINQVELSGTAVFKRDKMVGWLTPLESRGMLFFIENVQSAVVVLPCPGLENSEEKKKVSIELKSQKFAVTPRYEAGRVEFDVKLVTYGDMVESACDESLDKMKSTLEQALEKELTSEINSVVQKAQKQYKADFLKLGEVFNNKFPAEWKKLKGNWESEFTQAKVNVKIEAHINSPVLLVKPTKSWKGGPKK